MVEEPTIPALGAGEVRIKVLAAGTGFTDTFIGRGRYPDFKGRLPFTPGYDLVGVADLTGPGVIDPREGALVADLSVTGVAPSTQSGQRTFSSRCPERSIPPKR